MFGPRVGLALGGGAARGLAHLGVLEVLEEAEIRVDAVAGTSIGALIGAVWLDSVNAEEAIDRVHAFVRSDEYRQAELEYLAKAQVGQPAGWASMVSRAIRRGMFLGRTYLKQSFVSDENFRHNVHSLVPDVDISSLRSPFAAVATDLLSGESIVLRTGRLRDAVIASGAVPGLMPPQRLGDRLLVDGGLVDKVPVRALLSLDVDVIIGVDVSSELSASPNLNRGLTVVTRSNQVTEWHLRHQRKHLCDVMIRPQVQDVHWLNFSGARPAIRRGRRATEAVLPQLRELLRGSGLKRLAGMTRVRRAARLDEEGWFGPKQVEVHCDGVIAATAEEEED